MFWTACGESLSVPVLEHYGSSEGMQICANQLPPGRSKPGTCGVPWPNTVKIVGDDGEELPPGEQGEILIGGPTVISGYLNAPELNRACFRRRLVQDGGHRQHRSGRFSHAARPQGRFDQPRRRENLTCSKSMRRSRGIPAVAEAAAFAVPHARLGQDVAAAVVLRPGMTATRSSSAAISRNRSPHSKFPARS